ncbi:hypothetical protein ABVK25_011870 [Lepraria finkii]|uniref:Uncharacterized protein n=1 Tax=Lepraria finkii TaxID=1340010 RepID=A0ABR4AMB8_9LECA
MGQERAERYKKFLRRLQHNVAFKKDVKELRTTSSGHVSTINMSLMTQTLESVTAAETDRSAFAEILKDKHLALDTKLQDIKRHQGEAKVQLNTQIDGLGTLQGTSSRISIWSSTLR